MSAGIPCCLHIPPIVTPCFTLILYPDISYSLACLPVGFMWPYPHKKLFPRRSRDLTEMAGSIISINYSLYPGGRRIDIPIEGSMVCSLGHVTGGGVRWGGVGWGPAAPTPPKHAHGPRAKHTQSFSQIHWMGSTVKDETFFFS